MVFAFTLHGCYEVHEVMVESCERNKIAKKAVLLFTNVASDMQQKTV